MAVLWRLRYRLDFRDVAGLLLQRGYEVTHETIRDRESRFAPLLAEQSHRAVKQRYYPMLGSGSFEAARRFCAAFDELRQYFRVQRRSKAHVSPAATATLPHALAFADRRAGRGVGTV